MRLIGHSLQPGWRAMAVRSYTASGKTRNKHTVFHIICERPVCRFWHIITKMKSCDLSKPEKINEAVFPFGFLEGTSCMHLTLPHFLLPWSYFIFFVSISEIPLKYSGAYSSRHIFSFIVHDIKGSNYLISELWKHVCYEKTSKLSFNWCYFSQCWQGTYLFATFFFPHKIAHTYSRMETEISFCFIPP